MNQTMQTKWIALSVRIYRALLTLYPADYRREYGALMMQMFRDVSRDKYRQRGMLGVTFWWFAALHDLTFTVIEQRRKVKVTMSKSTFAQLTGMLLIAGGICGAIAAFSQFQPGNHTTYDGVYQLLVWLLAPSLLLIGLGNIGLGFRIDEALGTAGRWTLYLSGIGAMLMAVGVVAASIDNTLWNIWLGGGIVHIVGLTGFGLLHLRNPVLPIFRALPLQISLGLLILLLGVLRTDTEILNNALSFLMFFGMGLAWLGIGQKMYRQQQESVLAAA
jgi:hypothetical protein